MKGARQVTKVTSVPKGENSKLLTEVTEETLWGLHEDVVEYVRAERITPTEGSVC